MRAFFGLGCALVVFNFLLAEPCRRLFIILARPGDTAPFILYIGPEAPEGQEANWLATAPGRGFFGILRLYGPGEKTIDYSWKPGDFEKM